MKQTKTHFGFESVEWDEKAARVRGVFDSVASRYDIMNDAMSGGMHRLWKGHMVRSLRLRDGMQILDLAGGTGDIAFRMIKQQAVDVVVCDINATMLSEGRNRAIDKSIEGTHWLCGNAECLPLPDATFDACTIAFGIRNVTDIPAALRDIYRILKPGGQFACLEFSHVTNPLLKPAYEWYSFQCIPRMGELITKDRASYQYLIESIRQFPKQETFAQMIRDAGFSQVSYHNLNGGIVALHKGWRI